MLSAPQVTNIGGCGPQIVLGAAIMRLPASGTIPAGGPAPDGTDPHWFYYSNPSNITLGSDNSGGGPSHEVVMEFDPDGQVLLLPAPGRLEQTVAVGNYYWDLRTHAAFGGPYVPSWRSLSRQIDTTGAVAAVTFRVPLGHSKIGSLNESVAATIDGIPVRLQGTPQPCRAGQVVGIPPNTACMIFTQGLL